MSQYQKNTVSVASRGQEHSVFYTSSENAARHFTIKQIAISEAAFSEFHRTLSRGSKTFKNQAIVFVHGFANEFNYALFRLAQIVYDLNFDGVPFLYSWPSAGATSQYLGDEASAEQSVEHFAEFMRMIVKETQVEYVHFIAHSMGSRPLLRSLENFKRSLLPEGVRIGEIILAAPDIDVDVFRQIVPNILDKMGGGTIYASSNDNAMRAARQFAAGHPRLGDVPPSGPTIVSKFDMIDVSSTNTDVFSANHATYAERSIVLQDLKALLLYGIRPPDRRSPILEVVRLSRGGVYWRYPN